MAACWAATMPLLRSVERVERGAGRVSRELHQPVNS